MHNEIVVGAASPTVGRAPTTSYITSKVKARFVEANKFSATHVKVVTERSVVYLMGIVSRDEGDAAGADRQHDDRRRCASSSCSSTIS